MVQRFLHEVPMVEAKLTRHYNVIVWTATAQNWNKSFTHIDHRAVGVGIYSVNKAWIWLNWKQIVQAAFMRR